MFLFIRSLVSAFLIAVFTAGWAEAQEKLPSLRVFRLSYGFGDNSRVIDAPLIIGSANRKWLASYVELRIEAIRMDAQQKLLTHLVAPHRAVRFLVRLQR